MVAGGHEAAFEVISERYRDPLYRHCRAILNHHEDASDALQNTLLNAYRALSSRPRDLALRPWLYRIAHNESISLLRRRRPHAELDEAADVSRPGADHDAETNARLSQLVADLNQISERQRGALVMREISGLSYADIAASLAISENAAKQTVHEAHSALHDLEEGRSMDCEVVRSTLSVGDRRLLRGRKVAAHLRGCDGCRSFKDSIQTRRRDLAALCPPIPASLAIALLHSLFGGGGAGSTGGGGGILAGGSGTGGGILAGGGASTGATAGAATATATTAGAGLASAGAAAGGASAGAGAGILAGVTAGAGPMLAGVGVVKSLVPAAVGLTVGAGALGYVAPEPVTQAITSVERALEPRAPIKAPRAAPAPAPSGASALSQTSDGLFGAPSPMLPQALSAEPRLHDAGAPAGAAPLAQSAPQATALLPSATASPAPPLDARGSEPGPTAGTSPTSGTLTNDLPALGVTPFKPAPKTESNPDKGTPFESVTPTDAPPEPVADGTIEPTATEPVAPTPAPADITPTVPQPPPLSSDGSGDAMASSAPVAPVEPVAPATSEVVVSP